MPNAWSKAFTDQELEDLRHYQKGSIDECNEDNCAEETINRSNIDVDICVSHTQQYMDGINLDTIHKGDKNAINEGDIHDKGNIDPIDERDIHMGTVFKLRSRD